MATLKNIVTDEQHMHTQLTDGLSNKFEVFPNVERNFKVFIKDRSLPLKLYFLYAKRAIDFNVYLSQEH